MTTDVAGDAQRVFDAVRSGGVAIIPLDVAYAIVGHTAESIRRIFTAKARSYDKPSGLFSNRDIFHEVLITGERERDMVRAVTVDHDLPMSVVAPFRADHPFLQAVDPWVIERSTKAGTLDMLINAGPLHNAVSALSWKHGCAVLGSSANRSLTGSKFRLQDIEPQVLAAADVAIDHGTCRYENPEGVSSTIIDLTSFHVVRRGVCYDRIAAVLAREFGVELKLAAH